MILLRNVLITLAVCALASASTEECTTTTHAELTTAFTEEISETVIPTTENSARSKDRFVARGRSCCT
jgi:hypothetical protein